MIAWDNPKVVRAAARMLVELGKVDASLRMQVVAAVVKVQIERPDYVDALRETARRR